MALAPVLDGARDAESVGSNAPTPLLLAFVDQIAVLYADLWRDGKLDDILETTDAEPENE